MLCGISLRDHHISSQVKAEFNTNCFIIHSNYMSKFCTSYPLFLQTFGLKNLSVSFKYGKRQGSQSETAKCVFLMHNNSLYIIVESLNVSCIKLSIKVLNTTEEAVVSQSKQPVLKCPFVSANKFHFYPASSTSIMSNRS